VPFDFQIWILCTCVLCSLLLSLILMQKLNLNPNDRESNKSIITTPWLFIWRTIVDQSYSIPRSSWIRLTFQQGFIPWILLSIILSNCYKSLLIAQLNAPARGTIIRNLKDIGCPLPEAFKLNHGKPRSKIEVANKLYDFWFTTSVDDMSLEESSDHLKTQQRQLLKKQSKDCFAILLY